jgi:hypothetical protein
MKFLEPLVLTPVTRLTKQQVFAISDLPGSMMSLRPRERTSSRTYSNRKKKSISRDTVKGTIKSEHVYSNHVTFTSR